MSVAGKDNQWSEILVYQINALWNKKVKVKNESVPFKRKQQKNEKKAWLIAKHL